MPLGDDQKAMLRLLARGQSYEDIAALTGVGVEEVAARAKDAVAQLEAEGIPAPALPRAPAGPEGLVASPRGPQEQVSAPEPAPAEAETASATAPEPAKEPPREQEAAPPPPPPAPAAAKPATPSRRNRSLLLGGGIAALVAIVVALVLLLSGGDGGGETSGGDGTQASAAEAGARKPTTATLTAVDGSDATGTAQFGRFDESLGLGIAASGLKALPKGQVYMVWLQNTPRKLLPLTAIETDGDGAVEASYEVPTEAVIYLASGEFDRMTITRAVNPKLRASLVQANKRKDFPAYTGTPVLEGEIVGPIIGAAKRLEERQQEGDGAE